METIRLIGRDSRLSLLQLEIVKQRIETAASGIKVEIIARSSRGDELQDVPLQTVEGSDFFTQDIFDALENGTADIAVHSLKDMSSEHFFGTNKFAVVDRDDTRDVAIFQKDIQRKITEGKQIVIGTCSPRREEMAIGFLQKALPQLHTNFRVVTKTIRGNVDTRLRKLESGEYDGIILATAGLNRLLRSCEDAGVKELLKDKKLMLLPLVECVPAPCQGAIVAEAVPGNSRAIELLNIINNSSLMIDCTREKKEALQYGVGCLQKFGVTTFNHDGKKSLYAAGKNSKGQSFSKWEGLPELDIATKKFFSSTDYMGEFFGYDYHAETIQINEPVVYVANYKAVHHNSLTGQLSEKKVWAAGTKTWYELAKKGVWVEGSADAFGLETLIPVWQMPLIGIEKREVAVITNDQSKTNWQQKNWKVYSTYSLLEEQSVVISNQIKEADVIFWTSFRQYQQYKELLKNNVQHVCPFGETAEQFKAAGLKPVVFPNIKAFQQWRQTSGQLPSAA
jgi:hydroxymethylbilane synthase